MRRVSDPDGFAWSVDVAWTGVPLLSLSRGRWKRRARGGGGWLDYVDFPIFDEMSNLVTGLVIVAVIAFLLLVFPWLFVFLLDLPLLLLFPVLAIAIIGWRVARRRPFAITAARGTEVLGEWRVVGVREARRVERLIADAVAAGGDAASLFPEYSTRQ